MQVMLDLDSDAKKQLAALQKQVSGRLRQERGGSDSGRGLPAVPLGAEPLPAAPLPARGCLLMLPHTLLPFASPWLQLDVVRQLMGEETRRNVASGGAGGGCAVEGRRGPRQAGWAAG